MTQPQRLVLLLCTLLALWEAACASKTTKSKLPAMQKPATFSKFPASRGGDAETKLDPRLRVLTRQFSPARGGERRAGFNDRELAAIVGSKWAPTDALNVFVTMGAGANLDSWKD